MNCANHPQNAVAAYCRTCGKPLCNQCTRQVMGVIYCENCLAEKVSGTVPPTLQPAPSYQPAVQAVSGGGPNPALAGILAGFFPLGVGAVYCGQYVKGLIYLGVCIFLIVAQSSNVPDYLHVILGLSMGFFWIYQIIDAVRTAKALQSGQPAPDPLGLVAAFSPSQNPSATREAYNGVPFGALVLIGLGVLFLLHNLGLWFLRPGVVLSLVLIALGLWIYVRRRESLDPNDRKRGIVGPAVLVTLGVQALLDSLDVISFGRTLPALLIVIGVAVLIQRTSATDSPGYPPPVSSGPQTNADSPADTLPSTEVKNG